MSNGVASLHDPLDRLQVGQTESVTRAISTEDVAAFARLSGDYNALHVDDEFAARTEFAGRVVHGFLHASLLSNLVGMRLPGPGALYLSQTIDFRAPVYIDDVVTATGRIDAIDVDTRTLDLATEITNQNGASVLKGKARVKVLRLGQPKAEQPASTPVGLRMLDGRVALVTGASRGIGSATARLLAAHGASVWVNYNRSESAARELAREIVANGGVCSIVKADVTQAEEVRRMFEEILARGQLDILVNNAGPKILSSPVEKVRWSDMSSAYDDIVGSAFTVIQAALPALKESRGRIVNVLSSAALGRTAHNWLPYVAAKGALHTMSKNLAQELGPVGVRVNMVSPSMVDTDLVSAAPERLRQSFIGRTPLRRLATPEDVAGAILMLVSPYADFITGENLLVTGGDVMI